MIWSFFEILDQAAALFGARFFEDRAARHDDVAAAAIHLQDLEGLRQVHERADVAHRADVDLAARKEGHGAAEVDGEAALDATEDDAFDAGFLVELLFEPVPGGFAAGAVARQHRFAIGIFDAVDIDFDFVADLEVRLLAGHRELAKRHAAFALQADVDHCQVVFDRGHGALDDAAFKAAVGTTQRFVEHRGEIVARRKSRRGHKIYSLLHCSGQAVGSAGLVADPSRPPDANGTSSERFRGKAWAKQKGRDECAPSRPALDMQATVHPRLDRQNARRTARI